MKKNYNSLIGKKVFCRSIANEQLHMVLAGVTPNYLVFQGTNTGEYRVPIGNVLEISEKGVQLVKGQFWQE